MTQYWVLPEYKCQPIWRTGASGVENTAPDDLRIPGDLVSRFRQWAQTFEDAFDISDPLNWGFADAATRDKFYEKGLALARELSQAIPDAQVCYFDDRSAKSRLVHFR